MRLRMADPDQAVPVQISKGEGTGTVTADRAPKAHPGQTDRCDALRSASNIGPPRQRG